MQTEHTVEIQKIIAGGLGLAHLADGMAVMVPHVLPGETVRIEPVRRARHYLLARPKAIVKESRHRIAPPCPHYTICGGCDLQHASYTCQLRIKQTILAETLQRHHLVPETSPLPILPSADPLHYRYRLRLHLDRQGRLGMHRSRSNRLAALTSCLLAEPGINRRLRAIRREGLGPALARHCTQIELRTSPDGSCCAAVLFLRRHRHLPKGLANTLRKQADLACLILRQPGKHFSGPPCPLFGQDVDTCTGNLRLQWDSGCFYQVHPGQNNNLIRIVTRELENDAPATLLDLYCGMGNFSLPLALCGFRVTGVEQDPRAIASARQNADRLGQGPAFPRFIVGEVGQVLRRFRDANNHFDIVLLDPPRSGMGKTVLLVVRLAPQTIVYVSCDPVTMCRDIGLLGNHGYRLLRIHPVDMFPQTHHFECVAVLEKN